MGEFGDKFRTAREKKELSLDDVSNVTKISARMLQAIEQERFDQLPGGVFNKGFIRAYAKHLGLDPEEAVTDYLTTLRQAQIDAHEVWEPRPPVPAPRTAAKSKIQVAEPKQPEPKPPTLAQTEELSELQLPRAENVRRPKEFMLRGDTGIPRILIASGVVVIALLAFIWTRHSRRPQPTLPTQEAVHAATPASQAASVAPAASSPATSPGSTLPKSSSSPEPASKLSSAQPSSTSAAAKSDSAPATTSKIGSDVTVRTFGNSGSKPAPKTASAATTLSLIIHATETSWVTVQADGQPVTEEMLIAPAHYSVHAGREIVVRVGNAAGVSFIFNGKDLPAQGNEAEARTFVFNSAGMKLSQ